MTSPDRLPDLFARALELDPEGRRALVAATAEEDPTLAAELARLLADAEQEPSPLDRSPWRELTEQPAAESPLPPRIGPYRVLRELGRGGMGRVYLAEQEGEGFRRRVALKVVEPRGPAGTSPELERRVRAERRILAELEHPGIARFYDAGRDAGGAWYLALEYVEGRDLLDHVRVGAFGTVEKLQLFLEVVDAVAYAHSREIVHRDLKPANILVGADGRPRLLDFGIAKLLATDPAAPVTETRAEHRALTPAYASPEQFRGDRITPASDVFSLGVVLYELIAEVRPFAPDTGSSLELERAVLGEHPRAPSDAARRHALGRDGGRGRSRTTDSGVSRRALDVVCLKALEKNPHDRYRTAAELAADLRAVLERAPVGAVDARRRRSARAALAAALVAAGVAALVVTRSIRTTAGPPAVGLAPWPSSEAVPLEELRRRFAAAPENLLAGAQLVTGLVNRGHAGEAATVIGRLRQLPGASGDPLVDYAESVVATHLDEPQRALALSTRALAGVAASGRGDRNALAVRIRIGRARSLSDLGQTEESERELEAAAEEARQTGDPEVLSLALNDLAVARLMAGDFDAGERLLEEGLVAAREAGERSRVALIQRNLGGIAVHRGRPDLAEDRYREAMGISEALGRERQAASTRSELSFAVRDQGRAKEADRLLAEAVGRLRALDNETALADALFLLARAAIDRAAPEEVVAIAAEIEAGAHASGNPSSLAQAEWARALAAACRDELETARVRFAQAHRLLADSGNLDLASEAAVELAVAELESSGLSAVALDRLPAADSGGIAAFTAEALRARLDAESGRPLEARRRLERLGEATALSPSLSRRLAYLSARAELARAERRFEPARGDLETAAAAALDAGRELDALRLALRLAALDLERGEPLLAVGGASRVADGAAARGLAALATRARDLVREASAVAARGAAND